MNGQQEQKKEEQAFLSLSLSTTHATAQHFYVMWPLRTVYDVDDDASGHTYIRCPCNLGKKKKKKKKETKQTILTLSSPALSIEPRHTYMSPSLTNDSSRISICSFVNLRSTQVMTPSPPPCAQDYLLRSGERKWVREERIRNTTTTTSLKKGITQPRLPLKKRVAPKSSTKLARVCVGGLP